MAVVPAVIAIGHLFYGAYLPGPAVTLCLVGALLLSVALTKADVRRKLSSLGFVGPPATLFALVLAVAWLSQTEWLPGEPNQLWAWAGLPGSTTIDRSATALEMLKLAGYACFFLLGCIMSAGPGRARIAIHAIVAVGGVSALVSLLLFLGGASFGYGSGRLLGGFYSANTAATLFGCLAILALSIIVSRARRSRDLPVVARITAMSPFLALLLLFIACLLLTASRAGIGAFLGALILLLAWTGVSTRHGLWMAAVAGGLVLLIVLAVLLGGSGLFLDRFTDLGSGSSARWTILDAHWGAFLRQPLFGYGLGTYPAVNNQLMTAENFSALSETTVMHNAYAQWLEEAGVVGAAPMFLLVLIVAGYTGWKTWRRRRGGALLIGLVSVNLLVALHAGFDVSLQMPSFVAFWSMLLGLGFSYAQQRD